MFLWSYEDLGASHDKAYIMRFLMGLNENFDTFRSQIFMSEPFPSISKVYSLVLLEESHMSIGHGGSFSSQSDTVAMYAKSKGNSGNSNWNKGNNKKCKVVIYKYVVCWLLFRAKFDCNFI